MVCLDNFIVSSSSLKQHIDDLHTVEILEVPISIKKNISVKLINEFNLTSAIFVAILTLLPHPSFLKRELLNPPNVLRSIGAENYSR